MSTLFLLLSTVYAAAAPGTDGASQEPVSARLPESPQRHRHNLHRHRRHVRPQGGELSQDLRRLNARSVSAFWGTPSEEEEECN